MTSENVALVALRRAGYVIYRASVLVDGASDSFIAHAQNGHRQYQGDTLAELVGGVSGMFNHEQVEERTAAR